jgi:hypothetical protein
VGTGDNETAWKPSLVKRSAGVFLAKSLATKEMESSTQTSWTSAREWVIPQNHPKINLDDHLPIVDFDHA